MAKTIFQVIEILNFQKVFKEKFRQLQTIHESSTWIDFFVKSVSTTYLNIKHSSIFFIYFQEIKWEI